MPRRSPYEVPKALHAEFIGFAPCGPGEDAFLSRTRRGEPLPGNLFASASTRRAYGQRALKRSGRSGFKRRVAVTFALALIGLTTLMTASGSVPNAPTSGPTHVAMR